MSVFFLTLTMLSLLSLTFLWKRAENNAETFQSNYFSESKPVWNLTPLADSRGFVVSITLFKIPASELRSRIPFQKIMVREINMASHTILRRWPICLQKISDVL